MQDLTEEGGRLANHRLMKRQIIIRVQGFIYRQIFQFIQA